MRDYLVDWQRYWTDVSNPAEVAHDWATTSKPFYARVRKGDRLSGRRFRRTQPPVGMAHPPDRPRRQTLDQGHSVGQALRDGVGDCPLRLRRGLAERFIEIPRDSLPSS